MADWGKWDVRNQGCRVWGIGFGVWGEEFLRQKAEEVSNPKVS